MRELGPPWRYRRRSRQPGVDVNDLRFYYSLLRLDVKRHRRLIRAEREGLGRGTYVAMYAWEPNLFELFELGGAFWSLPDRWREGFAMLVEC